MRTLLFASLVLAFSSGCAGIGKPLSQPADYKSPKDDEILDDEPKTGDPFAIDGIIRQEQLPLLKGPQPAYAEVALADPPEGVPAPPASCDAWAKHPVGKPACADGGTAKAKLDEAMGKDGAERDKALAAMEACEGLPPGFVRSLRAELAPVECADALVKPFFAAKPKNVPGAVQHALVGQALAARLRRAVSPPPKLDPPFSRERVLEHHRGPLKEWLEVQAKGIQTLASQGAALGAYGKGIVATEAGMADLRLVEAVRGAPVPEEFKKDPELESAYFASLDESLDPRKARGRDGELVGLREMANAGVTRDTRTGEARAILSRLYGGRRVDALDPLLLPPIAEAPAATVDQRLAARLPSFYAGTILTPESIVDPATARALMERGFPLPFRAAAREKHKELSRDTATLLARARIELGIRYWRAVDFDEAITLLQIIPEEERRPDHRLMLALAIALRKGPEDTVALMKAGGTAPPKFGDVRALEVIANESGKLAGHAAFDAALLRELAAPQGAPAAYFRDVAGKWRKAERLVQDDKAKAFANDRAQAMDALAQNIAQPAND
jgi:hypothetical protein